MADGNEIGRIPPNDLDAEATVLSAILLDPEVLDDIRAVLPAADFYADANRRIYEAALELDGQGKPINAVSVAGVLRDRGQLQNIGGTPYLAQMADATPATAYAADHARRVAEKARQRRVIAACQRFAAEGYADVGDVTKWAQDAAQALSDVAAGGGDVDPAETFAELIPKAYADMQARARDGVTITGTETGWVDFTKKIGGWARGKLHVVGGRPGMGKSAFVLGACLNVAKQGLGVVFVSAEMTKEELALRALATESSMPMSQLESGDMNRLQWDAVAGAAKRLSAYPLSIRHCPGVTVGAVRGTVRSEFRRMGAMPGLVAVDYIQILDGERERGETRDTEIGRITKRFTWMAAEFGVPVIAVSQLNRGVEARSNKSKRPNMSDLRESGAIEQDAFTITLLYRDEYYNKATELPGVLEAIVAKHRNGPTGTVRLRFTGPSTRIDNLAAGEFADYGDDGL